MKFCRFYSERRCYRSCCSVFDSVSGNVSVCGWFRGGEMFTRRSVAPVHRSVFSKHLK